MARASSTFLDFQNAYHTATSAAAGALHVTVTTLYGGLLLRLQQDLAETGRTIDTVDWQSGRITARLVGEAAAAFQKWAAETLAGFDRLAATGDWTRLAGAADVALRHAASDEARAKELVPGSDTSYVVAFARRRAQALSSLGDAAWEKGGWFEAGEHYCKLLAESPVAWDRPGDEPYPAWRAGWRLALAATADGCPDYLRGGERVFPEFVHQVLVRTADGHGPGYIGEHMEEPAVASVWYLAEYARQHDAGPVDFSRRAPRLAQGPGGRR